MSDNHKEHPTPKKYVQIAIFLGVLTAIEVALYYTEDIVGVFTDPLLIFLAIGKYIVVVGWFMHLRFENKMVNRFFAGGILGDRHALASHQWGGPIQLAFDFQAYAANETEGSFDHQGMGSRSAGIHQ